jgi:hypothetical protein
MYAFNLDQYIQLAPTLHFVAPSELRKCAIRSKVRVFGACHSQSVNCTLLTSTIVLTARAKHRILEFEPPIMTSISRGALDGFKSRSPEASDPIWELVERYRRICQDKRTLQEDILHMLDEQEHEAELEVEKARTALAEIRMERQVAAPAGCSSSASWTHDSHTHEGRPAITDLDGPRDDPQRNDDINNSTIASSRVLADRPATDASDLPSDICLHVDASAAAGMPLSSPCTSTPVASAPDAGPSRLPADGSIFARYDAMMVALRKRSTPITSFNLRVDIPWPLLPSDGVFPVVMSGRNSIKMEEVEDFAAGYASWKGKPLAQTVNVLLGHWIVLDKRLKETSEHLGLVPQEAGSEVPQTRRWVARVRSRLYAIVAEQSSPQGMYNLLAVDIYLAQAIPRPLNIHHLRTVNDPTSTRWVSTLACSIYSMASYTWTWGELSRVSLGWAL